MINLSSNCLVTTVSGPLCNRKPVCWLLKWCTLVCMYRRLLSALAFSAHHQQAVVSALFAAETAAGSLVHRWGATNSSLTAVFTHGFCSFQPKLTILDYTEYFALCPIKYGYFTPIFSWFKIVSWKSLWLVFQELIQNNLRTMLQSWWNDLNFLSLCIWGVLIQASFYKQLQCLVVYAVLLV